MPFVTVPGYGRIPATEGQRLVLALEDGGVPVLHRCGGNARCTTCRVRVQAGDPGPVLPREADVLQAKGVPEGMRLSCQVLVHTDLEVEPVMTTVSSGLDPGPRPTDGLPAPVSPGVGAG